MDKKTGTMTLNGDNENSLLLPASDLWPIVQTAPPTSGFKTNFEYKNILQ